MNKINLNSERGLCCDFGKVIGTVRLRRTGCFKAAVRKSSNSMLP